MEASTEMTLVTKLGLSSPAFANGTAIPRQYTCDGADVSPPLEWGPAPAGTAAWVLVADDLDARGWVHWLVANLPPEVTSLAEDASNNLPEGAVPGRTISGRRCGVARARRRASIGIGSRSTPCPSDRAGAEVALPVVRSRDVRPRSRGGNPHRNLSPRLTLD